MAIPDPSSVKVAAQLVEDSNYEFRLFLKDSLLSILESASVCPVVYEILERLKLLYEFEPGDSGVYFD